MGILRETIRPSSDLRNKYPEISKSLQLRDELAIITVNGRGDTVSLGYNTYQYLKAKIELLEMLALAEDDERNGRMIDADDVYASIESLLQSEG